ncbi:hypothetical protein SAMN05444398_13015 [Roseovarius pacificus]|uniref:Transposase n=1 Tax=Roseovarius pacificus TaxID=337701 RepID=A0A1M7KL00_9RHOB|nr:hypothetical protein GCM10011315_43070 [Roseovarius pacificus]SHM65956.1 hypothetical protein SAMN05444398_13015 [Roseovarius pacificus]
MAQKPTLEFRAEAVRVALTSGLPRKQVAADFGIGFSTLSRWIQQDRRNPEKPITHHEFRAACLKNGRAVFRCGGFCGPGLAGWRARGNDGGHEPQAGQAMDIEKDIMLNELTMLREERARRSRQQFEYVRLSLINVGVLSFFGILSVVSENAPVKVV